MLASRQSINTSGCITDFLLGLGTPAPIASLMALKRTWRSLKSMSEALGVFMTFSTYATHLQGAETGSVGRSQNSFGAPTLAANPAWKRQAQRLMSEPPFTLTAEDRAVVLDSAMDACQYRRWHLFCAHVRSNHVHIVLQCDVMADRALSYLKARATFRLRSHHPHRNRFWTKHGSTRFLWSKESLAAAIDYVMNQQGPVMAAWSEQR